MAVTLKNPVTSSVEADVVIIANYSPITISLNLHTPLKECLWGHDSNLNAACFDGLVKTGQPALI
jgi:hypothetical protein